MVPTALYSVLFCCILFCSAAQHWWLSITLNLEIRFNLVAVALHCKGCSSPGELSLSALNSTKVKRVNAAKLGTWPSGCDLI